MHPPGKIRAYLWATFIALLCCKQLPDVKDVAPESGCTVYDSTIQAMLTKLARRGGRYSIS